jgi:hypothetical protein
MTSSPSWLQRGCEEFEFLLQEMGAWWEVSLTIPAESDFFRMMDSYFISFNQGKGVKTVARPPGALGKW